ncbi:uncharacterized protein LOC111631061 [Centruroides sculpturatus]|uniref:uncharacterized protein LOC111631061 n=1 Tax=Centruroides sculpturatus TaxID=218467 RepID=UPI000C6D8A5A|nr:uncharacterized protein LOC111631061 [Centruroides sculpturatus]
MSLNIDKKTMHITREIAVYSELHDLHTQICKALESESSLQLTNLNFNIPNLKGYHQGNVSLTRKYVLPFIKDVIKNMSNICSVKNTDEENKKLVSSNSLSKEGNIKNGTSYLLDVTGDPVSSQSSSNQNSCPYTPQNSYVEDSYEQDSDPLTLPSFNNRDMIAKIEEKRSKLGGFDGDSDFSAAKSIPFTPKNSEINISMKCPAEQNSESRVIFEQLQGKKDILNQFLEESKLKKQENIEDSGYSESSNGKELIISLTVKSDLIKDKAEIDAGINSGNISPDDSDTFKDSGTEKEQSDNRQNKNKFRPLNNFDGNDPLIAAHYLAETVDFPDSPQHLKLLKRRSREAQGITDDDEDEDDTSTIAVISLSDKEHQLKCDRPTTLNTNCSTTRRRKITVNPDVLSSDMRDEDQKSLSSLSNKSDVDMFSPVDDLVTPDDIDTPDDLDDFTLGNGYSGSDPIPELSATEEIIEERNWKTCFVGGSERKIDMKVIEPYKKVLSHGGYFGPDRHAIIVFGACYLPDRSRHDYDYVMDNLFLYVLTTLDQLVAEDYILIYFHGATRRSNMPSFGWLKRCYQMIDRRLRKNLKGLYLVHPTFWLKTIVIMTRPFISSKFSRKLRFINSLQELSDLIPMDHVSIPDIVKK